MNAVVSCCGQLMAIDFNVIMNFLILMLLCIVTAVLRKWLIISSAAAD